MSGLLQNKFVLVFLVGLAVAAAAWYGLTSTPTDGSLVTTTGTGTGPGQDLVETLLALRAVKLDGAIFTEQSFAGLIDFSTPIVPEPVGRPNPFAPLSFDVNATAAKDAALFAPETVPSKTRAGK